jgi:ABC-type polysaccharide/polyol phosphate export permease
MTTVSNVIPAWRSAGLRRRAHILVALARSDLRIRYGRGASQVVKWLVDPFALVGVYLLLRVIFDRHGEAPALSLACAVVPFQIVLQSATSAMSAVSLREPIVLNMRFDRMLIPPAAVLTESIAFGASFLMFPLTMLAYGVAPTPALLWLPLVVGVTLLFAFAVAWPAALLGLWVPQIKVFATQLLRIAFFASPGLIALAEVSPSVHDWMLFNPFTGLFESFRNVFLYGRAPEWWQLLVPTGVAVVLGALFIPLYRNEQRHFAKLVTDS